MTPTLIPKFEVQKMADRKGGKRTIHSKTTREMYTWGHYRFRQRLIAKSELYSWCTVVECDEAYTSKTCGKCGNIHAKLGSNKTFKCPKCDYKGRQRHLSGAQHSPALFDA